MFPKWLVFLAVLGATVAAARDNKKQENEALVLRALELSNIRAEGAPPFTLTATFQIAHGRSGTNGTYSETWISKDQWIREVTIGNARRLEIAKGRKKWLLDQDVNPRYFIALTSTFDMAGPAKGAKSKTTRDTEVGGISASCLRFDTLYAKEIYCIHPKDGTLMTRRRTANLGSSSQVTVSYANYEKLGDHLFPREMYYIDDAHAFDVQAIRAVQEWKFRPATCQGLQTAAIIGVEIEFHR